MIAVSNQVHEVLKSVEYDSFGNRLNDTNPSLHVKLGFAGGPYDEDYHSFPDEVNLFQNVGKVNKFKGGDGNMYKKLEIKGGYKGKNGAFEFIKDSSGNINHHFFKPSSWEK